jgi:uncharacterized protein YjdB
MTLRANRGTRSSQIGYTKTHEVIAVNETAFLEQGRDTMASVRKQTLMIAALVAIASCDRLPPQPDPAFQVTDDGPSLVIFPPVANGDHDNLWACKIYGADVRDLNGNIVSGAVVRWTVADWRVAYIIADGERLGTWTGGGQITVCGWPNTPNENGRGYGYTTLTAVWTGHPAAIEQRLLESGQSANGLVPPIVTVTPANPLLQVNGTLQMTATAEDQFGNERVKPAAWSSSDPSKVSVTEGGLVTALAKGDITITADVMGTDGSTVVHVLGVFSMTISPSSATICLNGYLSLTATARDQFDNVWTAGTVAWESTNHVFALVTPSGTRQAVVQAVGEGQAAITGTLDGVVDATPVTINYCAPQASVTGPYTRNLYQSGRYTATGSPGAPPYTYEFRRMDCPVSDFSCQPWGMWNARGSTNYWDTVVYGCGIHHIYVQSRVTDSRGTVSSPSGSWKTYINNPC